MVVHEQHSDRSRIWFDAQVTDNGDGTLTIPAKSFWLRDVEYPLAAYGPNVGNGPFRLWIEKAAGGAEYVLDLTGEAAPLSFSEGVGAPLVAWRDESGGSIQMLRSVSDA